MIVVVVLAVKALASRVLVARRVGTRHREPATAWHHCSRDRERFSRWRRSARWAHPAAAAGPAFLAALPGPSEDARRSGRPCRAGARPASPAARASLAVALSPPVDTLSDQLLVAHMVEHLLIGDLAALLIVLGFTGPLLAPLLRNRCRAAAGPHPPRAWPSSPGRSTSTPGTARALPGGASPRRAPRGRARDLPRVRDRGVDGPDRPVAEAAVVHQRLAAGLHRRGPARRHRPRQRHDLLRHRPLPLLPRRRRPLAHQLDGRSGRPPRA